MAEAILFALVEWSIRAAVLAGGVGALLWAARVKDAHLKLNAWTIALVAALLMPLAATVTPRFSISVPRFMEQARSPRPQPLATFQLPLVRRDFPAPQPETRPRWADVAAGLWLLVAVGMLFRLLLGLRLSARLVRVSTIIESELRESDLVRVPITVGVIQPQVILPPDWRDWPELKLRAVIAHERAHVARRDPLRQLGASIYRSVAWFHPLAWWLRAQITELAEEASDDAAISTGEDRVKYAEALLSFIKRTPQRVEWEGVTMANRQTRMRRIERVLDHNRKLSGPLNGAVLAGLVLAALPLVYLTTAARPAWAQAPVAAPAPQIAPVCGGDVTYTKWLNEDVAYIITNEERLAFVRLGAAAECGQFVEQFWLRRDPTPGTPQNEFKEEHYRRIALANKRFASAQAQGWATDRGRVYITYGPPDEIESHPSGGGDQGLTDPFDQWLYHHVDAVSHDILFEFVDAARDNEYRLVFMGAPKDSKEAKGPAVYGPVSGLYVQVNGDRSILITTPVSGSAVAVHGGIVDGAGATVQSFDDVAHSGIYGRWVEYQLPPGQYVLHLQVDNDKRGISFEVK